jgi:hypothetical protein
VRFQAFVGPSYPAWSPKVDIERAINVYPETSGSQGAKAPISYCGRPGLQLFTTLPAAPVRALWAGEDRLFAVGGGQFYEVFADGSVNGRGPVLDDAEHSPAEIWPNGTQLMVVSAGYVYIDNGGGPATVLLDNAKGAVNVSGSSVTWVSGDKFTAEFQAPGNEIAIGASGIYHVATFIDDEHLTLVETPGTLTDEPYTARQPLTGRTGTFLDSYFIVARPDSKQFNFSASYNGMEWDPLDYSIKEGYPDNIQAIYSDHEELWLFGTHWSTEVWRNEGDPDAAGGFRRDPGAFIHSALVAPWSVASLASGLHFLGGDTRGRTVAYRAQGFQPVRVSTHAVEQVWASYSRVSDAYAYAYLDNGHHFWVINFQTANATWVYDLTSEMWSEWPYWTGTAYEKHRGRCHAFTFGKHFVGDWQTGKIYEMSQNFLTDDGQTIRRQRIAPYVANEQLENFHHRLQIDLEVAGPLPQVTLDFSDDDGTSWSTPRTRTPSRPTNKAKSRVYWMRLGQSRERAYRITITDPVKVAITDALLELTPGFS